MRARHGRRTVTTLLAFGTILGLVLLDSTGRRRESERPMRWQSSIPLTFVSGADYSSQGTSVKINDDLGWGFGFGYHLNKMFMVGVDLTWLSANYDARRSRLTSTATRLRTIRSTSGNADAANMQFVGQYNILGGRVTPFLRASLGWSWIDSNIPSGPSQGVCWWDPWYGYICDTVATDVRGHHVRLWRSRRRARRSSRTGSSSRAATTCCGSTSVRAGTQSLDGFQLERGLGVLNRARRSQGTAPGARTARGIDSPRAESCRSRLGQ